MSDTVPETESIVSIIKTIDNQSVMLPEFQRDFRWELEQTYDLFDSLARDIFIGTIIYGKPSFAITCREFDVLPRKGKGSHGKLKNYSYDEEQIGDKTKNQSFRIVLDGQQRLTSLYRAVKGIDDVFLLLASEPKGDNLEGIMKEFSGKESSDFISIKVSDAYKYDDEHLREGFMQEIFSKTAYAVARNNLWQQNPSLKETDFSRYINATILLAKLLNRDKLISYYLLDMSLDKFCIFFERSNSRGIQLDFTDILAAKLYNGFNLRRAIRIFEQENKSIKLNRELIVRTIAYIVSQGRSIDKGYILKTLTPQDFDDNWEDVCKYYVQALNHLYSNNLIVSQSWMPSENMLLPLIMFLKRIGGVSHIIQKQHLFITSWFWASAFSGRYSTMSNEIALKDAEMLIKVAEQEPSDEQAYFRGLRCTITDSDDVMDYRKKASAMYKSILNILNYNASGLSDWKSTRKPSLNEQMDDHHIFPQDFIRKDNRYAADQQAQSFVDCVANRTLIPKTTNIQASAKAPSIYLQRLKKDNPDLEACLNRQLINSDLLDPQSDGRFEIFIRQRAEEIFALIKKNVPEICFGA
jgi:hypothetical protein